MESRTRQSSNTHENEDHVRLYVELNIINDQSITPDHTDCLAGRYTAATESRRNASLGCAGVASLLSAVGSQSTQWLGATS